MADSIYLANTNTANILVVNTDSNVADTEDWFDTNMVKVSPTLYLNSNIMEILLLGFLICI